MARRIRLLLCACAAFASGAGHALEDAAANANTIASFEQVRAAWQPSDWLLLDRRGAPLQRMRVDDKQRRLGWLPLDATSPALQRALITAEDKRFWSHGGVDWIAFARAALDKAKRSVIGSTGTLSGASTISMQLAAMLDPALQAPAGARRGIAQKWDQAQAARLLETQWSKPQILEAWLNLVPWRGETVGIAAASDVWFGKRPDGLDYGEAALLAALVRQPQAAQARVAQRACAIAASLREESPELPVPDCAQIKRLAVQQLPRLAPPGDIMPNDAPHAMRQAFRQWQAMHGKTLPAAARPGAEPTLPSTLDARVQKLAIGTLHAQLRELRRQNVEDAAIVVLDNASGDILAWVGSSGSLSDAAEVDGVLAPRQAGSTLKPFLYALAIEQRKLTAASLIDDSPIALTAENGVYIPKNYDRNFSGWISARTALASSLNIPAVRTLLLAGTDDFLARLRRVGLSTLTESADHYGLALALGGADVRLLDLANAYRALANRGEWRDVRLTPDANTVAARRVYSAAASFIVSDILSDRGARAPTFGLENALSTRVWTAVKTGTSKDMRDNWCVGFSDRYTVGVWVGNFSGAPMWDVSGVQGAAPIWRDLMHGLHEEQVSRAPAPPAGVVASNVRFADIAEASRKEWFLPGTQMSVIARGAQDDRTPHILYPASGLIVALDPDIPADAERLGFDMSPLHEDYRWQLERENGTPCRTGLGATEAWAPEPGEWKLSLLDPVGRPIEHARFSVRGTARHPSRCMQ